jgi:hypothetical protein
LQAFVYQCQYARRKEIFALDVGGKQRGATYIGSDLLKAVGGNRLDKMLTREHLKVISAFLHVQEWPF